MRGLVWGALIPPAKGHRHHACCHCGSLNRVTAVTHIDIYAGIKEYLASDNRHRHVFGMEWVEAAKGEGISGADAV
jgi:hypothetical protein